jgi:hypothetical protein
MTFVTIRGAFCHCPEDPYRPKINKKNTIWRIF